MASSETFTSHLHQTIYERSDEYAFKLSLGVYSFLNVGHEKPFRISDRWFQLVFGTGENEFYLFATIGRRAVKDWRIENGRFFVEDKDLPLMELGDDLLETPKEDKEIVVAAEKIAVPEDDVQRIEKLEMPKSQWWIENFGKYAMMEGDEWGEGDHRTTVDFHMVQGMYENPYATIPRKMFWFYSEREFGQTEDFWKELGEYYDVPAEELNKRLVSVEEDEKPPIFSRRLMNQVNLVSLHDTIRENLEKKIEQLKEDQVRIDDQLKEVEEVLSQKGIAPGQNTDYQSLLLEQKTIHDCISKSREDLGNIGKFGDDMEILGENVLHRIIDISGNPKMISKYYDRITDRLIDLNLEINRVQSSFETLERELIKRLKDVEENRNRKEEWERIDRESVLEDFRAEENARIDRARKLEMYGHMGVISENAAIIQRQIEEEQRRVEFYLDNLKSLSNFDDYDQSLLELEEKKRKIRSEALKLKGEVFRLKAFISRKELKYDEFFGGVDEEVKELRDEVANVCVENLMLEKRCVEHWKERWESEGSPVMEEILGRTRKIVEAFAPIPPSQILKISKLKDDLVWEVQMRKKEWARVFEEIKNEFRRMNYVLDTPMDTELDKKYLDQLDNSTPKLPRGIYETIFISPGKFRLSNKKDERIGLDPKTVDDEEFMVKDQVWETLTPEQEEVLNEKFRKAREEDVAENRKFLLREQLNSIRNRFVHKYSQIEKPNGEFTKDDKRDKYKNIEGDELNMWKSNNYLIANSRGEFRDTLYAITKKLFSSKSVRVVDNKVEFTDTGLVKDGNTEILSAKDYFIKPEEEGGFIERADDDLDLSEINDIHSEPSVEQLELLSDPTYVEHARERAEKKMKEEVPMKPTVSEWAQINLKKFRSEKGRIYEVETLRGKLLEMEDEMKKLKEYHRKRDEELVKALGERDEEFEGLKEETRKAGEFLRDKDVELAKIMKDADQLTRERIEAETEFMASGKKPTVQGDKKGFFYWVNRIIYGSKDDDFSKS